MFNLTSFKNPILYTRWRFMLADFLHFDLKLQLFVDIFISASAVYLYFKTPSSGKVFYVLLKLKFIFPYSQRFTPRTTPRPTSRPRLSVSTTTERFSPRPKNPLLPLLFGCDFTQASDKNCSVKFSGKKWQLFSTANERFYEVVLQNKERTEMFFSEMAPPPTSGIACLNFRYRKFLDSMSLFLHYL